MRKKSVLITGCSSGIGYEAAKTLVARGYDVYTTARKERDVKRLKEEGFKSRVLDLTDSSSIRQSVKWVLQETGGHIDVLFNNGAYGQPGAVEDLSRDALRAQFEANFFGWAELTNRVIPAMRDQGGGRIVQNSSILGFAAMPYRGAYNASKFAIEGLTDTLRLELAETNIRVSLIEPGPIESKFRANALLAFQKHIDADSSRHAERYENMLKRLEKEGAAAPFTLPASAVVDKLLLAIESPRPKARYYVTVPTHLFGVLKRILPTSLLDKLLIKAGGGGKR